VEGVTVTAITLLTVPARADSAMAAKYGSMTDVVPVELFDEVYAMFGYTKSNSEVCVCVYIRLLCVLPVVFHYCVLPVVSGATDRKQTDVLTQT
jgi:hypothetical protein